MSFLKRGTAAVVLVVSFSMRAAAQGTGAAQPADPAAMRQEIEQLRKELDELKGQYESRLAALEAKLSAQPTEQAAAAAPSPPAAPALPDQPSLQPTGQAAQAASNVFNPSTAVIGNFVGAGGRNTVDPLPALALPESEVSFQAVVDPYARADFFLSFGEEGVDLEEGFITFPTLPGGVLMRVGKMRSAFGKVNTLHTHVLPWVDRPLVTDNLLGGEEGITDAGISVARLIPNPWTFLEATGQVFRGDSGDVFQSNSRGDLSFVGHLRGYQDITESSNIDVGFSYAHGYNASGLDDDVMADSRGTTLFGVDATYRWKPLQRAIYTSFLGRGELVWSQRDQPNGLQKAFGMYVSGDYQFARRWFAGARYDRSGLADDASLHDNGGSFILTYKPTEFSLIRGQYRHINYALGNPANELLFQFLFAIGAHGAHPF